MGFRIPLGKILRGVIKGGPLRKILDLVQGQEIGGPGGSTIVFDEKQGPTDLTKQPPHKPGPKIGRRF